MIRQLPIRVRLTLWYSIVFSTALLSIGLGSLWMVHRAIDELENNELQQRVRSVRRFLESRPARESTAQLRSAITAAYNVSHGSKWLQVIDEHGEWLYRSPHVAAVYPSLALPQNIAQSGFYFNYSAESVPVSALIEPIEVHGIHYTVQTGLSLSKTLAVLSNFRAQLFMVIALGLIVSSLAGYFMSRKALTPIAAIASEAQRINDKNLNARMPALETHDELSSLSNTLNQMLGRIEAGYKSVRSFTANAAHELRSPVALLRAETEVALALPRDADYYRTTCENVLQNSVRMTRLIDHLLALARADAGVEVIHFEPVNLSDLLHEVADEWSERFAKAGLHFKCDLCTPEPWVEADFLAFKRLLNILLENAWRYTPSSKSVTLALGEPTEGSRFGVVEVSVTDTGIGISQGDQQRIFERFCHIARPVHGDYSGSGLGLALGQWIAERHNSTVKVESTLGIGSRFSLLLPICIPELKHAPFGTDHASGDLSREAQISL
jgi:signal transduction histidine kinase